MSHTGQMATELPDGLVLARTTDEFDNDTVPAGLLRAHRVAEGVWGRLVVRSGSLRFVFEDDSGAPIDVGPGGMVVIPPGRPHRVVLDGPARFVVEFHRKPDTVTFVGEGEESTGLTGGDPT